VGDAIGTTVEFKPRGTFTPLTDMVGGGPFNLQPGQWTDDTSMSLCLGHSLVAKGFDLNDQMQRYLNWHDNGYMSSTGRCFDIGSTTHNALEHYRRSEQPESGSADPHSAGNGSIMRLAPVPIYYMDNRTLAIDMSQAQSRTTHQAPECLQASALLAGVLVNALHGMSKIDMLMAMKQNHASFSGGLRDIANRQFMRKTVDQIRGTGYVVQSLEAALWCFWQTDSFKDCVLLAANLGDDADTTAAIAGQIAGAFYSESGIPWKWLAMLTMRHEITALADQLAVGGVSRP
jgi:ADP-ribosyl-[dinitrogen reductase] hydrolase